uniref:BBSome complex member BBS5 PH domain-containing protein n=1 Tax=Ditylenchus dipsaci TaxID=166011 RepID=A0A915D7C6_9BILA
MLGKNVKQQLLIRDVLFDLDTRLLRLTAGEFIVERIDNVEDTKGNNGDRGVLRVTICDFIGYNTITGITTKIAKSKIRGQAESLYIMSKGLSSTKFEFVFTCINPSSTKLFATVIGMHRAYETSKMYREMKMRSALCDKIDGVWNLSSDQGNLGVLIITSIRIVWYASLNPLYNVSIPFLQLRSCRVRDSRFGHALVLETSLQSGEYILGFRIDPEERLEIVCHQADFYQPPDPQPSTTDNQDQESEIDDKPLRIDAFAAYFSDGLNGDEQRAIVYSEELGVAIEQLKPGFTISELWEINVD